MFVENCIVTFLLGHNIVNSVHQTLAL